MYSRAGFLGWRDTAAIKYEKCGTATHKSDYVVRARHISPHIHPSSNGGFVGIRNNKEATTTLINAGVVNRSTIQTEIDDLTGSANGNDLNVKNALLELARLDKFGV